TPFFLTYPDTPDTSTLSLHDALPISDHRAGAGFPWPPCPARRSHRGHHTDEQTSGLPSFPVRAHAPALHRRCRRTAPPCRHVRRSEEHTSELQSRENLVCRLLLEKKK